MNFFCARLQDWRCLWCKLTVHDQCRPGYKDVCMMGPCKISVVPPTAIHSVGKYCWSQRMSFLQYIPVQRAQNETWPDEVSLISKMLLPLDFVCEMFSFPIFFNRVWNWLKSFTAFILLHRLARLKPTTQASWGRQILNLIENMNGEKRK